jgi:hypothetical protein
MATQLSPFTANISVSKLVLSPFHPQDFQNKPSTPTASQPYATMTPTQQKTPKHAAL